jgi:hypothetical protein
VQCNRTYSRGTNTLNKKYPYRQCLLTERGRASSRASYSSLLALRSSLGIDSGGEVFLSLTPRPPPFSAMNSTPAASRAVRMASTLSAVL